MSSPGEWETVKGSNQGSEKATPVFQENTSCSVENVREQGEVTEPMIQANYDSTPKKNGSDKH